MSYLPFRFPYGIYKTQELTFEESIAANFAQIVDRMGSGKLLNMAEIFWPVVLIQAEPNYKLMIDYVGLFNFDLDLLSAPRTPQVGHVLRQNMTKIEKLQLVKKIILFEENIQMDQQMEQTQEIGYSENETLQTQISGLIAPSFLEGFGKLLPKVSKFNNNQFSCLDTIYTFEDALGFAQDWLKSLNNSKGNRERWKTLKKILNEPISKWITDLNVQEKDVSERAQKKNKNLSELDDRVIQTKLDRMQDSVDVWLQKEQKYIAEKIGKSFKGIDLIYEDLRRKTEKFLDIEGLRAFQVGEVVMNAYKHVAVTREALEQAELQLKTISTNLNEIRNELADTNMSADEKMELKNLELQNKLQSQESEIKRINDERDRKIAEIKEMQEAITTLESEIVDIIVKNMARCDSNKQEIRDFQINDEISKITTTTMTLYIPIGIGIIEDEEEDEKIEIVFPSEFRENLTRVPLAEEFIGFEKSITKLLDENMRLRSNFEFTLEKAPDYKVSIISGFASLLRKGLISQTQQAQYITVLDAMEK